MKYLYSQGDPLSCIAFMLSALPALIKIQNTIHLDPYIHRLDLVPENDPIFNDSSRICHDRISETYSDDSFSTLVFHGLHTINTYNKVFEDAQVFSNLKVVTSKTRLVFNHILDSNLFEQIKQLGYSNSNIVMDQQNVSSLGNIFCVNDFMKGSCEQLKEKTNLIADKILA